MPRFAMLLFAFLACAGCGAAGVTPEPGIYAGALALQSIASALSCAADGDDDVPCCDEQVFARLAIAHDGDWPRANHQHAIRVGESIVWTESEGGRFFGCETERYDRWSLLADGTTHLERLVNLKCGEPRHTLVCRYTGSLSAKP